MCLPLNIKAMLGMLPRSNLIGFDHAMVSWTFLFPCPCALSIAHAKAFAVWVLLSFPGTWLSISTLPHGTDPPFRTTIKFRLQNLTIPFRIPFDGFVGPARLSATGNQHCLCSMMRSRDVALGKLQQLRERQQKTRLPGRSNNSMSAAQGRDYDGVVVPCRSGSRVIRWTQRLWIHGPGRDLG